MLAIATLSRYVHCGDMILTSLNVLLNRRFDHALVGLLSSLRLHTLARVTCTPDVKRMLQGISLPAEEVVTVPGIAGPIVMISGIATRQS